jgi:DNA-binding MarR family transcriptional regulator
MVKSKALESKRKQNANPLSLSNQVCFAFYSASLEMTKLYRPLLEPLGLTYPQYLVMLALWERSGISVKELGEQLHLDSGTLTPLLKRLEKMDLVDRRRNPEDERQVSITLTKSGEELRAKAQRLPGIVTCALSLCDSDLDSLRDAVSMARDHLIAYRRTHMDIGKA